MKISYKLTFLLRGCFIGFMFHRKPLYVAIAQRKDERQAQLHLQYAQLAGLAGTSGVIPGGYQPLYYTTPTVVPPVPGGPGMMYQPLGMRPGWRPNGFTNPSRPAFPQSPVPLISSLDSHAQW